MKKSMFTAVLIVFSLSMFSQEKPLRVEISMESSENEVYAMPVGKEGVIIFFETEGGGNKEKVWKFAKYNSSFENTWTKNISINSRLSYFGYKIMRERSKLYVLFTRYAGTMNKGKEIGVIELEYQKGALKFYEAVAPMDIDIVDFEILGDNVFLCGQTINSGFTNCLDIYCGSWISLLTGTDLFPVKASLATFNLQTERISIHPYMNKGNSGIKSVDIYKGSLVNALVTELDKSPVTYIHQYNEKAEKVNEIDLPSKSANKQLLTAQLTEQKNGETIVVGVYNQYDKRASMAPPANGFYFGKIQGDELRSINYYNFTQLKNFNKYMTSKQQSKTQKKKEKAERKGKELFINYYLLVHDIILRNNEYILIAEAYYPEYERRCYYTTDANGRTVQNCYYVFVGFRYTHAMIAAFDKAGELLWDNAFEIHNILTFDLKERVKILFDKEDIILVYNFNSYISSKIIRGDQVIEGKSSTKIETNYKMDKVKGDWNEDMDFWYDSYFIAYGCQRIKNTTKSVSDKKKRTVFYFNKIAFE